MVGAAERKLVEWQYKLGLGDFDFKLFELMSVADSTNLEKLEKVFPKEVMAMRRYHHEPFYWDDLQRRARLVGII